MPTSPPVSAVKAAGSDPYPVADSRRWWALGVMCFTVLLISLDATVLNVALPTLVVDLHPSASGVQWIADSYVLTEAVLLLVCGALGDRVGRRRVFLAGVAVFGAASLTCALVHTAGLLIAARSLTGVGAALLMPVTLSIITSTFPAAERARAIGIWAGVGGIGTAAGPLIGGWLLQHFWWGSVFIINVPVAVAAFIGALLFVSESRSEVPRPIDPVGVVLSAAGLAAITYALIVSPDQGWTSVTVLATLLGGVALMAAFVVWDGRRSDPLVDLGLFRIPTFSTGLAAVTAAFFAMYAVSFLLSQYIQFVQGTSVFGVGLRFLPLAAGTLIGSNSATRLSNRLGVRTVVVTGMVLVAAALVIYSTLTVSSGSAPILGAFALVGFGMGIVIAPASNAVMSSLPPNKVGVGSGLRSTVQLLGGSFGVAIIGNLVTSRYQSRAAAGLRGPLGHLPEPVRAAVTNQIGDAVLAARHLPPALASQVTRVADSSFVSGVRLGSLVDVAIMAVAIVAVARFIPSGRPAPGPRPAEAAVAAH